MDSPTAAPNQLELGPESGPESEIVPQVGGTIPWVTFRGLPNESSGAFVQRLQRIGFQQGRGRDDGWMAEYAATCFEGDVLAWYTELDDEVQESWKKLRTNLLRKYPPVAATVPVAPAGGVASSTNPSQPHGSVGRIEVVTDNTALRGYLSLSPTSGINITTDKDKAVIVSVQAGVASGVLHLDMLRSPDREFPYLGLALLVPQGGDRNLVPNYLPGISEVRSRGYGSYETSVTTGVPEPSAICQKGPTTSYNQNEKVALATWTFSACGESKTAALYRRRSETGVAGTRAAAAVWRYDHKTEELTVFWLMDNDTECELAGYVHKDTSGRQHAACHHVMANTSLDMNTRIPQILSASRQNMYRRIPQIICTCTGFMTWVEWAAT